MADVMQLTASLEWIVLGIVCLWGMRKWNKKFKHLYEELRRKIEETDNAAD